MISEEVTIGRMAGIAFPWRRIYPGLHERRDIAVRVREHLRGNRWIRERAHIPEIFYHCNAIVRGFCAAMVSHVPDLRSFTIQEILVCHNPDSVKGDRAEACLPFRMRKADREDL